MTTPKGSDQVGSSAEIAEEPLFVRRQDGRKYLAPLRARAFLGLVRAGAAVANDLDDALQRSHGLSLHAFEVLLHLAVFSPAGRLRLAQLVEQAPLSQSRVSRLVAELDQRGLVRRSADSQDRRGVEVAITDAGVELFERAQESHLADLEARVFSRLDWGEVVALARITAKLLDDAPSSG